MKIPLQRIPQIDIDGFVAYINWWVFDNPPERAPVTILKFATWLPHSPCSNLSIDSEEFAHNPITSRIPRELLHELADRAEIGWSDALRMSVWDLMVQAQGKVGEQEPDGKRRKGDASSDPPFADLASTETELNPIAPCQLLTNWGQIMDALEMQHTERDTVKRLNEAYEGPIPKPPRGGQPLVDRDDLVEWWNQLAVKQRDLANQRDGAKLSAEASHHFGMTGEVSPEIGGEVKKRRRDRKT